MPPIPSAFTNTRFTFSGRSQQSKLGHRINHEPIGLHIVEKQKADRYEHLESTAGHLDPCVVDQSKPTRAAPGGFNAVVLRVGHVMKLMS